MPRFRSDTVDPDPRLAVVALEDLRQAQLQRRALVRFGHDACVHRENRREELRERLPQAGGGTIWRVDEYEVVAGARALQEHERVAPVHLALDAKLGEVAAEHGQRL